MFRIKTDIRQYKCESREKVERLIRNWVVRPTDLIFDDETQEWGPIGEHSEFVSTFAELAKREEEAPETVVTEDPPPAVDADAEPTESQEVVEAEASTGSVESDEEEEPPREGGDEEAELEPPEPPEGVEPGRAEPDEITVMTEDTLESILEEGGDSKGEIDVVETRDEGPEPVEDSESESVEAVAADQPPENREATQPEAPRPRLEEEGEPGGEPTESTGIDVSGEGPKQASGESIVGEAAPNESTHVVDPDEREDFPPLSDEMDAEREAETSGEASEAEEGVDGAESGLGPGEAQIAPARDDTSEAEAEAERESTRVEVPEEPREPNAPQIGATEEADVEAPEASTVEPAPSSNGSSESGVVQAAGSTPEAEASWPKSSGGEEGHVPSDADTLPPDTVGDLAVEDEDLRDTDEFDEDAADKGEKLVEEQEARNRPKMPEGDGVSGGLSSDRSDEQLGRHDLPEEMFVTDELDEAAEDEGEAEGSPREQTGGRGDSNGAVDYAEVEEALQENARSARQQRVDDEWDEILQRLRETDELSKDELEEINETRDQIAIGRDEGDDEAVAEGDVPKEIEEYVSEGYDKDLPITVGPTSRDVQLGLRRSRASTEAKDRIFPYPTAKREGEVKERDFELEASHEPSVVVIAAVVGFVIGLVMLAIIVF